MILGFVTGLSVESVIPWCASARRVWAGRLVLLTDEPQRYAPLEDAYGVELVPADLRRAGVCDIARTRWEALKLFLEGESGPVVMADVRDVYFQADPVARVGDTLVIGSEGKPHRVNPWSLGWVNEICPEWTERMRELPVLCAGVIGGPAPLLQELAIVVGQLLPKTVCGCTSGAAHMGDQALINVLLRDGFAERTEVTEDWVFHCRSLGDGGPWIKADFVDGQVVRADGRPFAAVHHWDIVEQLAPFGKVA